MLSWRNARRPPTNTMTQSVSISTRCFREKAISAFMVSLLAYRPGCRGGRSAPGGGAVDEQAAPGDDAFAGRDPLQDLDHASFGQSGLELAQLDRLVLVPDPDAHRAALVDQRFARHRDAGGFVLREDADIGIHLGLEQLL